MNVQLAKLDLVVVGAPSADYAPLLADLERRIGRYVQLDVHELKGAPLREGEARVVASESARITQLLDRIGSAGRTRLVLCDRTGTSMTSEAFAERLLAMPRAAIVVGGACGVSDELRRRADALVAFGAQTLPHQLARLVLTEQVYRAFKIARGEPYHH